MIVPDTYRNRIICGDAVEVMQSLPDGCIDLIVTSPPYNLRTSTGNGMRAGGGTRSKWPSPRLLDGYASHADSMSHADYVSWQRQCLSEMLRLIPDNGAIFYNHKWRVQGGLLQDRSDIVAGFPVRQIIIWQRNGGVNFNAGYFLPTYEVIYLIAKPRFRLAPHANAMGDVWRIPCERGSDHPAPFPVELALRCVSSTTAKVVLDPFMGSGTTAVAARRAGRDYVGIEVSPEYCAVAQRRLADDASAILLL